MNKIITLREKLVNAIESKRKITKREFYAYEDVEYVGDAIEYFLEYRYHGDEDEIYETLTAFADPIAEELSKIDSDRMIKKRITDYILTLDTGLSKHDAKLLAEEITCEELDRRGYCRACPGRCLFDPDGDAAKLIINSGNPELRGLAKMLESKNPADVEVYDKEFEDDIIRFDKILKDRRKMNSLKISG